MRLENLNWTDVENYLAHDDRIIVIAGTTQQHAHLSLQTNTRTALALADAVAAQEKVLIAPPLNFGCSAYFMDFPGTINLSEETYARVLFEIVQSLVQHGFRHILFLNGHGDNFYPEEVAALLGQVDHLVIQWYNWKESQAVADLARQLNSAPDHANWVENFSFTRVGDSPTGRKPPIQFDRESGGLSRRTLLGDGAFGGLYEAPAEQMRALFHTLVDEIVTILREMRQE